MTGDRPAGKKIAYPTFKQKQVLSRLRLSVLRHVCARSVRIDFGREQTERKQKKKTQAAVKKLLENVEKKLGGEDVKASLGDYIRLLQLQQELDEDEPKDITVTWVDPKPET